MLASRRVFPARFERSRSPAAEAIASILIVLNKTYEVDGAGIRITGHLTDPED